MMDIFNTPDATLAPIASPKMYFQSQTIDMPMLHQHSLGTNIC